ncbi:hypothetical protein KMZ29_01100 [Bradyrhizobium sediminis]|uniref:Uncharacterized protein n=1 Tax=Bradyrhizobium sediminis TaxID=2840469 RepID=A0A975RNB8_9BRAD|nr:hypothetical protein [Bradyrhizobium sediminis]QWG13381.1 hypothetical protein KMZ29_01100 [Bradyrhizobium sediminis]
MSQVLADWSCGGVLVNKVVILYLVDEAGLVRFSIEEAVDEDVVGLASGRRFKRLEIPYLSGLLRTDKKLGHPSLVNCGGARIAGQILFQPANGTGVPAHWTIDAWSGRYGRTVETARRESRHIDNVIAVFQLHGIELKNAFGPL